MKNTKIIITGQIGKSGGREVFMAFEKACVLHRLSFADIYDENTGLGYQRRFNREHSLGFKKYINKPGTTTIPLTFNLRPETSELWKIERPKSSGGLAKLIINNLYKPIMAQVDCQHRLGYMADSDIEFAFITYIALDVAAEMEIFRDINGKAKGLSSSLIDLTEAKQIGNTLNEVNPALYYAMRLAELPSSPWYQKLDRGGKAVVGTKRVASLRTMQQAIRRFLKEAQLPAEANTEVVTELLISFWQAVSYLLKDEWENPRRHLLNKSIGVYSLMSIAGDLTREANIELKRCDQDYFIGKLSDFIDQINWSNDGALKGFGGVKGADAALELIRHTRKSIHLGSYGKQEYSFN